MFWLNYECFSILCDAFWLKIAISSHNCCDLKDVRAKFLLDLGQKWQKTDYFQESHFS